MRHISRIKQLSLLLTVIPALMLAGCKEEEVKEEVDVSDYLNEQALEGGEERQYSSYIIEDVVTGTFCVVAKENAEFHIQDSVAAYADYEYGTMLFDKYAVIEGAYVEAGEPVVKVHINVSEADITAARLAIQRMEERVEADRVIYEKEDAILKRNAYSYDGTQTSGVAVWEYETSLEHHRQDIEAQQKAIEKAKENLAKMEEANSITEITAPISGYVKELPKLEYGKEIPNKMIVGIMEPENSGILTVDNDKNAFRYGKAVKVICKKEKLEKEFTGVVITPSQSSVAIQASDRKARILLDEEGKEYLRENKVNTIEVRVNTVEQENALMVKMGSLEVEGNDGDNYYATVVQEDGSFLRKKVIVGGISDDCYWVMEGLKSTDSIVVP